VDSASDVLPDLEVLSVAEMKSLLRKQHVQLIAQGEQLAAKDEQLGACRALRA
jgi:hypothetical protein